MSSNANTVPNIQYYNNASGPLSFYSGSINYLGQDPFATEPRLLTSPNKGYQSPLLNSTTIVVGPREVDFTPNTLGTTKHVYYSPLQSDMKLLAQFFGDFAFHYHITEDKVYTMTVDVPWDDITLEDYTVSEFVSEQWEIVPIEGSKNLIYNGLLANPFQPATEAGNYAVLPLSLQSSVQRAQNTGGNYLNITGSLTPTEQSLYAPYIVEANTILQYLKIGIEGVPQYTQQLKRTAVVDVNNTQGAFQTEADDYRNELSLQGTVNFLLSYGGMTSHYSIPQTVADFMYPSYSKVLGVPNIDPIQYNVYAGYVVQPPTITFIGLNKIQITQLFSWGEWASGMFYIASPQTDFPLVLTASLA
jgi:hypothetical protein